MNDLQSRFSAPTPTYPKSKVHRHPGWIRNFSNSLSQVVSHNVKQQTQLTGRASELMSCVSPASVGVQESRRVAHSPKLHILFCMKSAGMNCSVDKSLRMKC